MFEESTGSATLAMTEAKLEQIANTIKHITYLVKLRSEIAGSNKVRTILVITIGDREVHRDLNLSDIELVDRTSARITELQQELKQLGVDLPL